jgi:hypothetical protein
MARTDDLACAQQTVQDRILYCPEFRRVVLDFKGVWFVFRLWEFERLRLRLTSLANCPFSRGHLERGEEIRIRDAGGRNSMQLRLEELDDLIELMQEAAHILDAEGVGNERITP